MDDDLKKQIQTRMSELPPDILAAIKSADFGNKIHAIGTRHQLHIDQIGRLEDEVLLVMLAFSEAGDFVPNVVEQVHVTEDVANIIADEVSNEILRPIRESMRQFMEARAAQNVRDALLEPEASNELESSPLPPEPVAPAAAPAPAPVTILSETPPPTQTPPPPPVVRPKPEFRMADEALTQQTVTLTPSTTPAPATLDTSVSADTAPQAPATSSPTTPPPVTPRDYATDPYHEPIE